MAARRLYASTSRSERASYGTGRKLDPFSLRRCCFSNSAFSESVPVKLTSALGATAGPAGVIHFDSVGFRQFQEGQGLVRLDRPVALDEVDTVPRLRQRQRLRHTLASPATRLDPNSRYEAWPDQSRAPGRLPHVRGERLGPAQEDVPVIEVGDQRTDHRLVESPSEAGPGFAPPGPGGGLGDGNANRHVGPR